MEIFFIQTYVNIQKRQVKKISKTSDKTSGLNLSKMMMINLKARLVFKLEFDGIGERGDDFTKMYNISQL